jgi:hypothetical protein
VDSSRQSLIDNAVRLLIDDAPHRDHHLIIRGDLRPSLDFPNSGARACMTVTVLL